MVLLHLALVLLPTRVGRGEVGGLVPADPLGSTGGWMREKAGPVGGSQRLGPWPFLGTSVQDTLPSAGNTASGSPPSWALPTDLPPGTPGSWAVCASAGPGHQLLPRHTLTETGTLLI